MRTNSGVKPKGLSNAAYAVLLFLFMVVMPASASVCIKDTLILDGEVIEIEQKDVVTNTDSIEKAGKKDIKKQWPDLPFSFGIYGAPGLTTCSPFDADNHLLDDFLDLKPSREFSYSYGVDLRGMLREDVDVGIGLFFSKQNITSQSINTAELAPAESRRAFENVDGQLWQRYVVFIDPGFEERFTQVNLNRQKHSFRTLEVPLSFRYYVLPRNQPWSAYFSLNAVYRQISNITGVPAYFDEVKSDGTWNRTLLMRQDFNSSFWSAMVDVGAQWKITESLRVDVNLSWTIPKVYLMSSQEYNWRWNAGYVRVGLVKDFLLNKPATLFK
ncbi:MAG: hypothetical protein ACOYLH_11755 [Flavobacteriales bacterium]